MEINSANMPSDGLNNVIITERPPFENILVYRSKMKESYPLQFSAVTEEDNEWNKFHKFPDIWEKIGYVYHSKETEIPDSIVHMEDDAIDIVTPNQNIIGMAKLPSIFKADTIKSIKHAVYLFELGGLHLNEEVSPAYAWSKANRARMDSKKWNGTSFCQFCKLYIYIHMNKEYLNSQSAIEKGKWRATNIAKEDGIDNFEYAVLLMKQRR